MVIGASAGASSCAARSRAALYDAERSEPAMPRILIGLVMLKNNRVTLAFFCVERVAPDKTGSQTNLRLLRHFLTTRGLTRAPPRRTSMSPPHAAYPSRRSHFHHSRK